MTSLAAKISTAILRAWGCGLVDDDVVAFVVLETGASADKVVAIIKEMHDSMKS
jgi:hypothetical protein